MFPLLSLLATLTTADALPTPKVRLTVSPGKDAVWIVDIANEGTTSTRIRADAWLLVLDVKEPTPTDPRKARFFRPKNVRFQLPSSFRNEADGSRWIELPPGGRYSEIIPLDLVCFGSKERGALVKGAKITPHLGWPAELGKKSPKREHAPFVFETGDRGLRTIDGESFELQETPEAATEVHPDDPLELTIRSRVDVQRAFEAPLTISLKNRTKNSIRARIKPEALRLYITNPNGVEHTCDLRPPNTEPLRDFYVSLRAGGASTMSALLSELCDRSVLERKGLYRVRASFDTTPWADVNEERNAFTGVIKSNNRSYIRIRVGDKSWVRPPPTLAK